jgi:HD-like signal output (HDOD) protein
LQDANVGLDEVANLIKRDATLAARIIRMSNSVIYGGHGGLRIGAIEDAVNRVGFSEVYRLVGLVTSDRLAERSLGFYGLGPQTLRENMLFTALAAETVADEVGIDSRNAYTAGLLRPLGMLVLDRVAERLTNCEPYEHSRYGAYLVWEGIMFGLANSEVACMVLADWRFPQELVAGIREHYLTSSADYENRFACMLNVACRVVSDAGHTLIGDRRYWEYAPKKMEALGLDEDGYRRASDRAAGMFERLRASLS